MIAPNCAMAKVQNKIDFCGSLSSQNHSSLNSPINQTNSTGTTGTSANLSMGTSIKLNPDAEVFRNPRIREQGEKSVADSQGNIFFHPTIKTPEISKMSLMTAVKIPKISSRKSHFPETPQTPTKQSHFPRPSRCQGTVSDVVHYHWHLVHRTCRLHKPGSKAGRCATIHSHCGC